MNPTLNSNVFKRSKAEVFDASDMMTVKGAIAKTFVLLALVFAAASVTWKMFYQATNPSNVMIWTFGGLIAGFVLAIIISFKPKMARVLSPVYAVCEGLCLGGISAIYNSYYSSLPANSDNPVTSNIVVGAILLTFVCALVMGFIYYKRIIRVTSKFTKVLSVALISILVFYLIGILVSLFGGAGSNLYQIFFGNGPIAIAINVVIVLIAAFSLLQDYNFIEQAANMGAPKYMEWYGAFGLVVTLVWLYLEILKLLGRLSRR